VPPLRPTLRPERAGGGAPRALGRRRPPPSLPPVREVALCESTGRARSQHHFMSAASAPHNIAPLGLLVPGPKAPVLGGQAATALAIVPGGLRVKGCKLSNTLKPEKQMRLRPAAVRLQASRQASRGEPNRQFSTAVWKPTSRSWVDDALRSGHTVAGFTGPVKQPAKRRRWRSAQPVENMTHSNEPTTRERQSTHT
jgi:hypothetical protein